MYDTVDFVKRAVANGACGYLMKDAPPFELEQAAAQRHGHRQLFQPGDRPAPVAAIRTHGRRRADPPPGRNPHADRPGPASKEIAFELGLSPKTVDVHRARIMERLRLNDIASLTLYAVRKGLIKP